MYVGAMFSDSLSPTNGQRSSLLALQAMTNELTTADIYRMCEEEVIKSLPTALVTITNIMLYGEDDRTQLAASKMMLDAAQTIRENHLELERQKLAAEAAIKQQDILTPIQKLAAIVIDDE